MNLTWLCVLVMYAVYYFYQSTFAWNITRFVQWRSLLFTFNIKPRKFIGSYKFTGILTLTFMFLMKDKPSLMISKQKKDLLLVIKINQSFILNQKIELLHMMINLLVKTLRKWEVICQSMIRHILLQKIISDTISNTKREYGNLKKVY